KDTALSNYLHLRHIIDLTPSTLLLPGFIRICGPLSVGKSSAGRSAVVNGIPEGHSRWRRGITRGEDANDRSQSFGAEASAHLLHEAGQLQLRDLQQMPSHQDGARA